MHQKIFLLSVLFALTFQIAEAQGVSVKRLPFCKKNQSEIAPMVYDSLLYFSSDKNVKWLNKPIDQDNNNFYNLFTIQQASDSSWMDERQFEQDYFLPYHTSTIAFYPEFNEVFFTETQYKHKQRLAKNSDNLHGIFVAGLTEKEMSKAQSLPFNSRRSYNTAHPTLSSDGQYLFFVSDQEGGYGQTDIYVSERDGDSWGPAINMGPSVNTEGSEVFPFYHQSGKLYFASNGHAGEGGLDILYTVRTDEGWSTPINLGNSINTAANEFSCYISADGQSGYFASDRTGDDDLYEFITLFPVFGQATKQKENTFTYRFYDTMGGKGDGPLKYVWHFGDGQTAEGDTVIHQYKQPGNYHVQSLLVDSIENVELFVLNDFYQEVKKKVQVYITSSDNVRVGEPQTLDALESNLGDFEPNGFYWELPDGTRQKGVTIQYVFRTKGKQIVRCGTISKDDPNLKMCTYKEINVIE
ncbi:PD40 domain-containing protein [Carboxylicivirga sediminis]|uniref:PD40 domain-containing protein n=1 Tax=Carboxylicivirga sediminis TaxID=2006564 RepID=A0A941F4D7_9BACT|nr:PKD domain-containing protein [Carboxylicivirga sediminis]MBR8536591.1 PD40 domain-containing protein [Carboxylicivirga sediminis]